MNKSLLYQAKTMRQLKIQVEAYQKIKSSVKQVKYDSHFIKCEHDVAKVEKCRKCFNCFRCNQPVHRTAQCKVEMVAKQDNTNLVQVEAKTKPTSVLTYSGLELNYIVFRRVIFKGFVDTDADARILICYVVAFI